MASAPRSMPDDSAASTGSSASGTSASGSSGEAPRLTPDASLMTASACSGWAEPSCSTGTGTSEPRPTPDSTASAIRSRPEFGPAGSGAGPPTASSSKRCSDPRAMPESPAAGGCSAGGSSRVAIRPLRSMPDGSAPAAAASSSAPMDSVSSSGGSGSSGGGAALTTLSASTTGTAGGMWPDEDGSTAKTSRTMSMSSDRTCSPARSGGSSGGTADGTAMDIGSPGSFRVGGSSAAAEGGGGGGASPMARASRSTPDGLSKEAGGCCAPEEAEASSTSDAHSTMEAPLGCCTSGRSPPMSMSPDSGLGILGIGCVFLGSSFGGTSSGLGSWCSAMPGLLRVECSGCTANRAAAVAGPADPEVYGCCTAPSLYFPELAPAEQSLFAESAPAAVYPPIRAPQPAGSARGRASGGCKPPDEAPTTGGLHPPLARRRHPAAPRHLDELPPGAVVQRDPLGRPPGPLAPLRVARQADRRHPRRPRTGAHVVGQRRHLAEEVVGAGEGGGVEEQEEDAVGGARRHLRPAARRPGQAAGQHVHQQTKAEALVRLRTAQRQDGAARLAVQHAGVGG